MSVSVTVDFSTWERQFSHSAEKTIKAADNTVKTVAKRLLQRIKEYTPIGDPNLWHPPYWPAGYVPGTLRASWTLEQTSKYNIEIKNVQPYANRVEFGWSTQAPEGMMRRAVLEYPILLQRTWQEYKI